MKNKKKQFNVDEYLKEISDLAKNAPETEEILAEFEKGDYSSLDPEFFKEWEVRLHKDKKTARQTQPKQKVKQIRI